MGCRSKVAVQEHISINWREIQKASFLSQSGGLNCQIFADLKGDAKTTGIIFVCICPFLPRMAHNYL